RAGRGLLAARAAARAGRRALLGRVAREQLDDLLADTREIRTQVDQHLGGHALALADQTEQHVLGADVVVTELQRFAQRQLEDLLGPGRERRRSRGRRAGGGDRLL